MTKRVRVKMCGMTRVDDAICAAEEGADALGFVFYDKSPRHITPANAAAINRCLPPFVSVVGLFVDESAKIIDSTLSMVSMDVIQFHGNENSGFCRQFHRPYIKAIRVTEATNFHQLADDYFDAKALLLDAFVEGVPGGTGKCFDWSLIPKDYPLPLVLAGGLTPENVSLAIKSAEPSGVDVSGGIEMSKGIKDSLKIKAFLRGVHSG